MTRLNESQEVLAELPVTNILVLAPAGCGKTEALAQRAASVIARGDLQRPRKILGLTFSNKARDNFASRLENAVGPRWRQWITVSNFHGLAARVIRAHGELVGVTKDVRLPEVGWRKAQLRDLGLNDYQELQMFENALRTAKFGVPTNDEVDEKLQRIGNDTALDFEKRLRAENRLDWDDLMRLGGRLLSDKRVAALYQAHFGMVMVDEVQDLTIAQFEMVRAVGGDRVTYAGDPAQGIYSFAGARPNEVFASIEALEPMKVTFTKSYRSAPAVLRAVNELASVLGAPKLSSGDPGKWPDEGHVKVLEFDDTTAEAAEVLELIGALTSEDSSLTVGVIGRRNSRYDRIRSEAETRGLDFEDWSTPLHNPRVAALIQRSFGQASGRAESGHDAIDHLDALIRSAVPEDDASTLYELSEALDFIRDQISDGVGVAEAIAMCRPSLASGRPVAPGLHLLNGHKGKGQEFDWVFILGLEDGHIPDFRSKSDEERLEELRVLHVMVSRARYGLVATYCRNTHTRAGLRASSQSPWLALLRKAAGVPTAA